MFSFDPGGLAVVVLLVALYARAVVVLRRRGYDVPGLQQVAWYVGVALIAIGLLGPLDSLAIHPETNKAYMHVDECWYCGPCAARCPTDAVTINMPYLLR